MEGFTGGSFDNFEADQSFGGGGGGGFNTFNPSGFSDPAGGNPKRMDDDSKQGGGRSNQTLRPVTIRQILNLPAGNGDSQMMLDGEEIRQVSFVGVLRHINIQTTNRNYQVEDGTGSIEVRVWINNEENDVEEELALNTYVRVIGEVKVYNNNISVVGHNIRPISDHNEVSYHMLYAIYAHLLITKGAKGPAGNAAAGAMATANILQSDTAEDPIQIALKRCIRELPPSNEGFSIETLHSKLSHVYSMAQIRNAVEYMVNEGNLYWGSDDKHLRATGA